MGIIGSHVDLYLLAAGTSSKTAVGSGIRLIVRAIRRLSRTGISTVAGAMGISRQEPPRKTLHSLCYPPRDAPLHPVHQHLKTFFRKTNLRDHGHGLARQ